MSNQDQVKVGLISCSGEEISEGTLSRAAVRLVLEKYRPGKTVTICLPLFLAGDGGERGFARKYPTIAVDGCGKLCAKKGTEAYSGAVDDVINVDELLKAWGEKPPESRRDFTDSDWQLAERVANVIAERVDKVLEKAEAQETTEARSIVLPECACTDAGPKPEILRVGNQDIQIMALSNIMKFVASRQNLTIEQVPHELLKQVRIYNGPMEKIPEETLREALAAEYRKKNRC